MLRFSALVAQLVEHRICNAGVLSSNLSQGYLLVPYQLVYVSSMAETKRKGDLGVAMVMSEVMRRGYKVAMPVGEDWPFDIIVLRNGKLERLQCKYTESDGDVIDLHCRSANNWVSYKYTSAEIDWMALYDKTTDACYFVPSEELGTGRSLISLRITPTKNGQTKGIRFAAAYQKY